MDWQKILEQLTVTRLARLAAGAGFAVGKKPRKAKLVELCGGALDDALKHEALRCFRAAELRLLAESMGVTLRGTRKHELCESLLTHDQDELELVLSEQDFLLPDRERLDLPRGDREDAAGVELLPSRPGDAAAVLFFELQELLRRPTLRRAVLVSSDCRASVIERLLGEGLDDLIESAARKGSGDYSRALTVVLDGERHGLGDSESGRALASLARALPESVELRLTAPGRRLRAKVLAFEEVRPEGPVLTAIVGSAAPAVADASLEAVRRGDVESYLRIHGPLDSDVAPTAQLHEWIGHLLRESRALGETELDSLGQMESVAAKVGYKRELDTAHELRLKHLAEQLCRRGRFALPMFDPTLFDAPLGHQRAVLAMAGEPGIEGMLLCDEHGLGKTLAACLILARELRRRRIHASSDTVDGRRALVVAPVALHQHWREELSSKLALDAQVVAGPRKDGAKDGAWLDREAPVLIVGPELLREQWEDLQGFAVVVFDECQLLDEKTLAAAAAVRAHADLGLVLTGSPVENDVSDVLALAALAAPKERWESYASLDLATGAAVLGAELRPMLTRARRSALLDTLPERRLEDRFYELDLVEGASYEELRRMRYDYLDRSSRQSAWAFVALEQAFLSSSQALNALSAHLCSGLEVGRELLGPFHDFAGAVDDSFVLVRGSGYFQRRLRGVLERLGGRCHARAPVSAKEAALLEILSRCNGERVVVFTRYRATLQRLATVLVRARAFGRIDQLDAKSSLRERVAVLASFERATEARAQSDGPKGVLLCSDEAAVGLPLHRVIATLVNYDLPWNPQAIEARIERLQRIGQKRTVIAYNLAARSSADGWSMDSRVLYACRKIFGMDQPKEPPSEALYELDPLDLERELSGNDEAELDLLAPAQPEVVARFEALLADEPVAGGALDKTLERQRAAAIELGELDRVSRARLADFWSRVSYGGSTLEAARGYLFGRLRLALLQGQVGLLCAPGCEIDACYTFHLAVGLRILVEAAVVDRGTDPMDEQWLVDDELVYLWAVAPDGQLVDWAEYLMGGGFREVPQARAAKLVGPDVVAWLATQKRSLESVGLDALPLDRLRPGAPASVGDKLDVVKRHAQSMAKARLQQLAQEWGQAKLERLERLRARLAAAERAGASVASSIAERIAEVERREVRLRREILGTQLFVVLH